MALRTPRLPLRRHIWFLGAPIALSLVLGVAAASPAGAAQPPIGMGTASAFAVLAGTTVTNTGSSTISGDVGVSPGTAVTGFSSVTQSNGTVDAGNPAAAQAQSDLTTAYGDAASAGPSTSVPADLTGLTLSPGVYAGGAIGLTGTVTLNGNDNPDAVFIFQAASTLITGSSSKVVLTNGAQACNVFWQVTSSATLGTASVFDGTIMALTSIAADTGASVAGRLLARNGGVTLQANTITTPTCTTASTTPTTTVPSSTTPTTTVPSSTTPTTTVPSSTTPTTVPASTRPAPSTGSSSVTTSTIPPLPAGPPGTGGIPPAGTDWPLLVGGGLIVIGFAGGSGLWWRRRRAA
jgi:hypothetical protein